MKKIILAFAMMTTYFFIGCSSNDNEDQKFKLPKCVECFDNIVGQKTEITFCNNGDGTVEYTYCTKNGRCKTKTVVMADKGFSNFEEYMVRQNRLYESCPYIEENLDKLKGN